MHKNCILCIIMRLIFIFFGPSAAEFRKARENFMHIINILCINPNSDVSHRYRRRTVTELLVSREEFPQSGQNIEHFQFFVQ